MNIEQNRKSLIEALRSEKYGFGRGYLRKAVNPTETSQICVWCIGGVMCEEYRLANPLTSWWEPEIEDGRETNAYGSRSFVFFTKTDKYGRESSVFVPTKAVLNYYGISWKILDDLVSVNDNDEGENVLENLSEIVGILEQTFNDHGIVEGEW